MKQLVWLGYHNFSWNSSLFWILSIVRLSFNCFAAWFWTRPLKHRMFNWVQSSRTVFFDISLLNHGFSDCLLAFGIARLTFKCCLSRFSDSFRSLVFSAQIKIWKENRPSESWIWTFFSTFLPIDKVWLDASVRVWNWKFFVRRMLLRTTISQNVPNLGFFWKKCVFSQNFYAVCHCRNYCHKMDRSQTDFKIVQGKFCITVKSTLKICIVSEIRQLVSLLLN